jgi:cytochrome c-type protein NapB
MRRKDVRIWSVFLFLVVALAGCLPTLGETVMPEPPTAPPPPTALPVVAMVPPPIPHTVEEARQDCLLCHAMGAVEASPIPADANHEEAEELLCRTCHALLPQPAPPAIAPPAIPHDLVGREDCLMCHKMGIAYAPRIPDNHSGLPVGLCQTCHKAAPTMPLPEETRVAGVMPPQVPHPLEGRTDCRLCHETGVGGAPQFPPDHVDRANEVCLVCHVAASEPTEAPVSPTEEPTTTPTEAMSAAGDVTKGVTLYATHCAACHGDQGQGTAIAKEPLNSATFLASRSDEDLRQAVADGVPGTAMSSYSNKLSSKDIADIIAFFRSWQQ